MVFILTANHNKHAVRGKASCLYFSQTFCQDEMLNGLCANLDGVRRRLGLGLKDAGSCFVKGCFINFGHLCPCGLLKDKLLVCLTSALFFCELYTCVMGEIDHVSFFHITCRHLCGLISEHFETCFKMFLE